MKLLFAALAVSTLFAGQALVPGQKLNSLSLHDLSGAANAVPLAGKTTVVVFLSAECPVSNEYNDRMSALYREYTGRPGVAFYFVNANANESARAIAAHAKAAEFPFPVYQDRGNALADRLGATVTPETYVFDRDGVLRYHGHIDDARNPARVQSPALRSSLDAVLAGRPVTRAETKAFGCTIKRVRKSS